MSAATDFKGDQCQAICATHPWARGRQYRCWSAAVYTVDVLSADRRHAEKLRICGTHRAVLNRKHELRVYDGDDPERSDWALFRWVHHPDENRPT